MLFNVLLYYHFTNIQDPKSFVQIHRSYCSDLGIKGRIYISDEGINGTIGGTPTQTEAYKAYLKQQTGFTDIEFKEDHCDYVPFAKLVCKVRKEIVALRVDEELNPAEGGNRLEPEQWRKVLESDEDHVILDVRNNYEYEIGHFEGALKIDEENFYAFKHWLDRFEWPKEKKVLMYCTGGIRCEKFSVLMKKKGWEDVNQLHGGIINYGQKENGKYWNGKCFVFDDRLVVPINPESTEPLAKCEITGEPADAYLNCANIDCNKLFICSIEGARKYDGCCSEDCSYSTKKRPFNPDQPFRPFRKWYEYFGPEFKEQHKLEAKNAK